MQYLHSCHCLRPLHGLTHFLDTRTQPVLVLGIIILQVQDPVFAFVEFQMLPLCPSLQPLKLPLKGYTATVVLATPPRFVSSADLLRTHLALHPSH